MRGWGRDGTHVLFSSPRDLTYQRGGALFLVSVDGGLPERLAMPYAWDGDFSGDGARIAYQPFPSGYSGVSGWRHYRGGTTPPIWLFDLSSHEIERIPHDPVNDSHPMWVGEKVYFVSDRNGTANIFSYEPHGGVRQMTRLTDWDVRWAHAGDGALIFEAGGRLHLLDPATEAVTTLHITIHPDLPDARSHWVPAAKTITASGISPTGSRALFAARGDILTVPAEKGDVRDLTRSPGSHERSPLGAPDGSEIAYVSDASGEYRLVITPQDGLGESRTIDLGPPDHYTLLAYSPDSSRIVYAHSGLTLYAIATSGKGRPVAIDAHHAQLFGTRYEVAFSPDSRWLAYTKVMPNRFRVMMLHDFKTGANHQITEGMGETASPVFSHDGKYLYFTASTNIGPAKSPLDMTSQERPVRRGIYAAVLRADGKTPLPLQSDDEKVKTDEGKGAGKDKSTPDDEGDDEGEEKSDGDDSDKKATRIDVEGLSGRIVALPVPERDYVGLAVAKDGDLFYIERRQPGITVEPPGSEQQAIHTLRRFDGKSRKQESFIEGVAGFAMSADGSKMLVSLPGRRWSMVETGKKPVAGGKALNMSAARVLVDPRREWRQIYEESWRILRDFFWDPNMHGADWQVVHDKYSPLVDHVGSRQDLSYVLVEMLAELVSSHARAAGGDTVHAEGAPVGLLGADYTIDHGHYRIELGEDRMKAQV
ncbi:MAG: peptidase S41, partial [Acidobacteriota bacterium]